MKSKRKFSAEAQGHKVKMKTSAGTLQSAENCPISTSSKASGNRAVCVLQVVCAVVVFAAAFGQLNCDKRLRVRASPAAASAASSSSSLSSPPPPPHPDYLPVFAALGRRNHRQRRALPASATQASSEDADVRQQPPGADSGLFADPKPAASFEGGQRARVVASSSQTEVFLPCKTLDLDEQQTVSWIRKADSLVLTIDKLKLIDDPRFQLAHSEQDWTLVLSQPSHADAGLYECQVSSMEPKLSRLVELRMIEAHSRISNLSTLFLRPNERLNVTCTIESPQRTDFVYWYKNKEPVQFDNLRARQPGGSGGQLQQPADPYIRRASSGQSLAAGAGARNIRSYKQTSALAATGRAGSHLHDDDADEHDDDAGEHDDDADDDRYEHEQRTDGDRKASAAKKGAKLTKQATTAGDNNKSADQSKASGNSGRNNNNNNNNDEAGDVRLVRSSSSFIIKQVQANDTANYTCLPSNAKASHINVIVIENGGQSQPEKRSLQAIDGACSLHIRNTFKLSQEIFLLGQLIKLRLLQALGRQQWTQLNSAIMLRYQMPSQPNLPEFELRLEQQSIVNQLFKLILSQELIRILLTLISMVFYSRRRGNLFVVT